LNNNSTCPKSNKKKKLNFGSNNTLHVSCQIKFYINKKLKLHHKNKIAKIHRQVFPTTTICKS